MSYRLFAVTLPGLEPAVRQELAGLGIVLPQPAIGQEKSTEKPGEETGGVEFEAGTADLYRLNLHMRSASRILMRFGDFYATTFSELRASAAKLPWEQHIRPGHPVSVRVTCHKSKLYHSSAVAERVAGAISDRLKKPIQVVKFDEDLRPIPQLVIVRIAFDQCYISLDTSGELLHRRGYHLETAKAPLRETLAAGLVLSSGWDGVSSLMDPFCGSGTIPIEAAMLAGQIAPGKNRRFSFMGWTAYDSKLWSGIWHDAVAAERPAQGIIRASDRDEGAIRISIANAERMGVLDRIDFSCRAVSAVEPLPAPGWMVTNPPYGVRISPGNDLRDLYAQYGNVLRAQFRGWQVGVLCSDRVLVGQMKLRFAEPLHMVNGGIHVGFYRAKVE